MLLKLQKYIESVGFSELPENRKAILQEFIDSIQQEKKAGEPVNLNFICTHNSRRSHLAQVWAQTMARFYGLEAVSCYSGGTEATALFPKIAETLENSGFEISKISEEENPVYAIKFDENRQPVIGFSKKYNHPFNPKSDFIAIMTCSHADENCPLVLGAKQRIPITYQDPKISDGTSEQGKIYAERSRQIAMEMKYVFSKIFVADSF
ncbi:MAG: arsenate reductase [Arenicella sp.]|jgi:arsenate reductase